MEKIENLHEIPFIKANLHTHSTFCDGKNTLEENVLAALKKGFKILGFSSHSLYPFYTESNMLVADFSKYCDEIKKLKEKYKDKIELRLGFEADYIPGITFPRFDFYSEFNPDFLIGSVHFIYQKDGIFAVDDTPEKLFAMLEKYYKDDGKKLVGDYFEAEREMLEKGDFTVIGHADLIRKFNEKHAFFDENAEWYKRELKNLAKAISKAGVIAEINTGAMSRGWTTKPYPSEYFLALLRKENVPVTLSSDSHSAENLDFGFDLALSCAKKAGYKEIVIPGTGFFKI